MKNRIIQMTAVGAFLAFAASGCGEKFTPLTQQQIETQVDSLFNAQKQSKLQELRAACQSNLEEKVNAKVETMKNPEIASK